MHHIKKTLIAIVLFVTSITAANAQSNITLPEPIVPRRNAGKYIPKLDELRIFSLKKQWKEFGELSYAMEHELAHEYDHMPNYGKPLTMEEFDAREWMFYYVCKNGIQPVSEMWNNKQQLGSSLTIYDRLHMEPRGFETFSLDRSKFAKIRAAYMAVILRNLRIRARELSDEIMAIPEVRRIEYRMNYLRTNWDSSIRKAYEKEKIFEIERKKGILDSGAGNRHLEDYEISFRNTTARFAYLGVTMGDEVEMSEVALLRFLFGNFPDNPTLINSFINMAGYEDEADRAAMFANFIKESENWGNQEVIDNFLRKSGVTHKQLKERAPKVKIRQAAERKKSQEKWAKVRKEKEVELNKLNAEFWKAYEKYRDEHLPLDMAAEAAATPPPPKKP